VSLANAEPALPPFVLQEGIMLQRVGRRWVYAALGVAVIVGSALARHASAGLVQGTSGAARFRPG